MVRVKWRGARGLGGGEGGPGPGTGTGWEVGRGGGCRRTAPRKAANARCPRLCTSSCLPSFSHILPERRCCACCTRRIELHMVRAGRNTCRSRPGGLTSAFYQPPTPHTHCCSSLLLGPPPATRLLLLLLLTMVMAVVMHHHHRHHHQATSGTWGTWRSCSPTRAATACSAPRGCWRTPRCSARPGSCRRRRQPQAPQPGSRRGFGVCLKGGGEGGEGGSFL